MSGAMTMTNKETKTSVGKLPKPYAEGLKSLVSPKWMAVWNAYLEQRARIVELEQQRDAAIGVFEAALEFVTDSYRPEPKYDAERFDRLVTAVRKARALLNEQEQEG